MPTYRLKPRLPLWRISLAVLALLMLPALIDAPLPAIDANRSHVKLGTGDWLIDATWPDGTAMECEEVDDTMFAPTWNCDGTQIGTLVMEGSVDEAETLRRGIRAVLFESVSDPLTIARGDGRLIETSDGAVGISLEGHGEHEGKSLIAVVSGENPTAYSKLIWALLAEPEQLSQIENPQETV